MTDMKFNRELEVELIAITPNAQKVIEQAARTCYQSLDKMGEDTQVSFIERLTRIAFRACICNISYQELLPCDDASAG
jgi:hypothetical protein